MLSDLKLRLRAILRPRAVERELEDELAFHVEREARKLIDRGVSIEDARWRARARFGSIALAADECRDARGTAFIDTLVRDVLYSLRTLRHAPLSALTIALTVGLGLGLVTVVFTFFNAFFLRADAVRNPGELVAVIRPPDPDSRAWIPFTRRELDVLRRETDVFTDSAGMLRVTARLDGRSTVAALVTGSFFQVLGVNAALGRPLAPADDEPSGGRPVIVLSHKGWANLFGRDPSIVGRSLAINGAAFEVVGVMPADFRGLSLGAPDYWAPLSVLGTFRADAVRPDEFPIEVVGRLKPGVSADAALAALTTWGAKTTDLKTSQGRPAYFRLDPKDGTLDYDDLAEMLAVFVPTLFAFTLILLIGCANVANLLLARGLARAREIGTRLTLGASRSRIVRQLLSESLLLALLAAACALAISRAFLDVAIHLAISSMPPELAEHMSLATPPADWRVILFILTSAVTSTVFFGLAPALQATRVELVRTMRGEIVRNARPGRARSVLIALQVTASALLLICAAVFLRSAAAASAANPGVRTSDTLVVPIKNEQLRAAIVDTVTTHPAIAGVAASSPSLLGLSRAAFAEMPHVGDGRAGGSQQTPRRAVVEFQFVSPEYFEVLDIDLVRGRPFTQAERNPASGVVVMTDRKARELWPDMDPLGQAVRLHTDRLPDDRMRPNEPVLPAGTYVVVGIVRTVERGVRMFDFNRPDVFLPIARDAAGTSLMVRGNGDPAHVRLALLERLTRIDPAFDDISTLRTMSGLGEYLLRLAFWLAVVVGGLALLLTVSGLFSVLSYLVEQRRQEIGVRMALGASPREVVRFVVGQSLGPVAFGVVVGAGLAGTLATVLMTTSAASYIKGVVQIYDPIAYASSLVIILFACTVAATLPARRAARIDPITTLRQE